MHRLHPEAEAEAEDDSEDEAPPAVRYYVGFAVPSMSACHTRTNQRRKAPSGATVLSQAFQP